MTDTPAHKWTGLGYEPVPGFANRLIARYLRGQRRNMTRFFTDRGLLDLTERMHRIRKSRQGMLAKNRMFQKVLNDYAQLANPQLAAVAAGTPSQPAAEAGHPESEGAPAVDVPAAGASVAVSGSDDRLDAGGGVQEMESATGDEPVIEE